MTMAIRNNSPLLIGLQSHVLMTLIWAHGGDTGQNGHLLLVVSIASVGHDGQLLDRVPSDREVQFIASLQQQPDSSIVCEQNNHDDDDDGATVSARDTFYPW
jgi:hypothetical protein